MSQYLPTIGGKTQHVLSNVSGAGDNLERIESCWGQVLNNVMILPVNCTHICLSLLEISCPQALLSWSMAPRQNLCWLWHQGTSGAFLSRGSCTGSASPQACTPQNVSHSPQSASSYWILPPHLPLSWEGFSNSTQTWTALFHLYPLYGPRPIPLLFFFFFPSFPYLYNTPLP